MRSNKIQLRREIEEYSQGLKEELVGYMVEDIRLNLSLVDGFAPSTSEIEEAVVQELNRMFIA